MKKLWPAVLGVLFLAACSVSDGGEKVADENVVEPASMLCQGAAPEAGEDFVTTDSGLKYQDLKVGSGDDAKSGKMVRVNYIGTLGDGTKFDSSCDRGEPFVFELGAGDVIKGWDEGVAGMKVGGIRKLVIPAELGYGSRPVGSIPANSILFFDVEFLGIVDSANGD